MTTANMRHEERLIASAGPVPPIRSIEKNIAQIPATASATMPFERSDGNAMFCAYTNKKLNPHLFVNSGTVLIQTEHTSQNLSYTWLNMRMRPPGARISRYSLTRSVTSALGDIQLTKYSLHSSNGRDRQKNKIRHNRKPRCKSSRMRSRRRAPNA